LIGFFAKKIDGVRFLSQEDLKKLDALKAENRRRV
jgi:hypothetical protein